MEKFKTLNTILVGIMFYLSYGVRSVGLLLLPSLLIFYELIKLKRPTRFFLITTVIFITLATFQTIFIHRDRSYFDQFKLAPRSPFFGIMVILKLQLYS